MIGNELPIQYPPRRVVSLVPSMTESLFDLGFGDRVVGVTDYCIRPAEKVATIPRVGGPKNFRIDDIVRLQPDLVIANQEENDELLVRQLNLRQVSIWLTFPHTVNDALKDLLDLAGLFRDEMAARAVLSLERSVEYCRLASEETQRRYFCPIWQEDNGGRTWWMTFNGNTYSSDVLAVLGGENIFAGRTRKYPLAADLDGAPQEPAGSRDTRYPRVRLEDIAAEKPTVLIFPDEPFEFSPDEQRKMCEQLGALMGYLPKSIAVDGSLITWPGTRISKALEDLTVAFS
jgi:iron complex transport system substrate-binding protein